MYDPHEAMDSLQDLTACETGDTGVIPSGEPGQVRRTITYTRADGYRMEITAWGIPEEDSAGDWEAEVLVVLYNSDGDEVSHMWESIGDLVGDWNVKAAAVLMWGEKLLARLHRTGLGVVTASYAHTVAPIRIAVGDELEDSDREVVGVRWAVVPYTADTVTVARARSVDFEDLDTWIIYAVIDGEDMGPRELGTAAYIEFCEAVSDKGLAAAVAELA